MQPVRQLYQNDADVAHHGKDHLAEIFCLRLGVAFKFYLGEFTDPVNQFRDIGTELGGDLFLDCRCILYDVMQDSRDDGLVIQTQFGQDAGGSDGVVNVGFAGHAMLAIMGFSTKQVGAIDFLYLLRFEVRLQHAAQVADQES